MSGIKSRRLVATGKVAISDIQPGCVREEIEHDRERSAGGSVIEVNGIVWRKRHGFGRPFSSGASSGHGYQRKERLRAAETARRRKAQKASRVRNKVAQGIRSAGIMLGKALMLTRKAGRGQ